MRSTEASVWDHTEPEINRHESRRYADLTARSLSFHPKYGLDRGGSGRYDTLTRVTCQGALVMGRIRFTTPSRPKTRLVLSEKWVRRLYAKMMFNVLVSHTRTPK